MNSIPTNAGHLNAFVGDTGSNVLLRLTISVTKSKMEVLISELIKVSSPYRNHEPAMTILNNVSFSLEGLSLV